ncbi:MAG: STAS domain-containing protein [Terracidiphilus sp.]
MAEEAVAKVLTVSIERQEGVAVVRLRGKLVAGMGGQLCGCVTPLIGDYKRIVLDLGELEYMDSLGLGTMVRLYVSAKAGGCSLELIHLGKRVRELLGMTNLLGVFTVIGEKGGMVRF